MTLEIWIQKSWAQFFSIVCVQLGSATIPKWFMQMSTTKFPFVHKSTVAAAIQLVFSFLSLFRSLFSHADYGMFLLCTCVALKIWILHLGMQLNKKFVYKICRIYTILYILYTHYEKKSMKTNLRFGYKQL